METYCADKFDKFDKIHNNILKIDNNRLFTTYPFIDFYRFPIQLTNFIDFINCYRLSVLSIELVRDNYNSVSSFLDTIQFLLLYLDVPLIGLFFLSCLSNLQIKTTEKKTGSDNFKSVSSFLNTFDFCYSI